jgi:predicted dehydrogenase
MLASDWKDDGSHIRLFDDLAQALLLRPDAAVVATSPLAHAADTRTILDRDIHVMVEKPFALRSEDASDLVQLADKRGLILGVGLHLFYASYLIHFQSLWHGRAVSRGRVIWLDPKMEVRYGEIKQPDFLTPKIHDAFPHVWSILRVLFPESRLVVEGAESGPNGAAVLSLSVDSVPFSIIIDRRARERSRRVELEFADGGTGDLDFTIEPGIPRLNGAVYPVDPDWGKPASPLTLELAAFLAMIDEPENAIGCPTLARNVVDSVSGAVLATTQLREKEAAALALLLARTDSAKSDSTVRALLVDNLVPEMRDFNVSRDMEELLDAAIVIATRPEHRQEQTFGIFARLKQSDFLNSVKAYGAVNRQ